MKWYYDILDIKIKDGKGYSLHNLSITLEQLTSQIKGVVYSPLPVDGNADYYFIPSMVIPFYYFILLRQRIPTEGELLHLFKAFYLGKEKILNESGKNKVNGLTEGIVKYRINKAYPSLIRDFHFYLMLHEKGGFDSVAYSVKQDMEDKCDIEIISGVRHYHVRLFADTENSNKWFEGKTAALPENTYPIPMTIKLDAENSDLVGKIYLFKEEHMLSIQKAIDINNKIG